MLLRVLFKLIFVPLTKVMVYHRKPKIVEPRRGGKDRRKSDKSSGTKSKFWRKIPSGSTLLILFVVLCFLGGLGYAWWKHYKKSRLYTPIVARRIISRSDLGDMGDIRRFWGSYRSNLYFGLRTRSPNSLMLGLMWFSRYSSDGNIHIRHSCEQSDKLPRYGWIRHDGINFGTQEIVDNGYMLTTDFVKRTGGDHGGDWTARISGQALENMKTEKQHISVMFYITKDGLGKLNPEVIDGSLSAVSGITPELGKFKLSISQGKNNLFSSFLITHLDKVHNAKDVVRKNLRYAKVGDRGKEDFIGLPGRVTREENANEEDNFIVFSGVFELPFQVEVIFESDSVSERTKQLSGPVFQEMLMQYSDRFEKKFEQKFKLRKKGHSTDEILFAQATLSNALGGIGFFHGTSKVISDLIKTPVDYWESCLYTGVPSRSFFPRGFLWDEGFHQLLISQWDNTISTDVIGYWLDLMNIEGWIPREQILGDEARTKVPAEFVVQHNKKANPPALFLPIKAMRDKGLLDGDYLRKLFPRLRAWYNWLNTTQAGKLPSTYRWRGRDATTDNELNPKTLTSGLDDYPRASHPSDGERHLDLRCWMAMISGVMADISETIGKRSKRYRETYEYLRNEALLSQYHWSESSKSFADYGNHTKFAVLRQVATQPGAPKKIVRKVKSKTGPHETFVDSVGYVSLFPFLLQLLDANSSKLEDTLEHLRNPDELWSDYGIRSLSKSDPLYGKYNTEHDAPYWRGAIWINLNFLAVRALYHYSRSDGPYQQVCLQLYEKLRSNIIKNIFENYQKTGYVWENYDDQTGMGKGCHPFTGWSSLVVLMMGEMY